VGYADGVRGGGLFPSPWDGSANVIFEGCTGGCTFDGGAIKIQNTSSSTMTIAHVTASIGSCTFDIWPKDASLPAGQSLIYAQETDGASEGCTTDGTFDTSDVLNYPQCVPNGTAPIVNITVGTTTDSYVDSGEVLDTGGIDPGACSGSSEAQQWVPIGSSPYAGTVTLGYDQANRLISYGSTHNAGCYSLGGSAGVPFSGGLDITWNCTGRDGQRFSAGELSAGIGPPGPKAEIHGSFSVLDAISNQVSRWVSGALCWLSAYASGTAS